MDERKLRGCCKSDRRAFAGEGQSYQSVSIPGCKPPQYPTSPLNLYRSSSAFHLNASFLFPFIILHFSILFFQCPLKYFSFSDPRFVSSPVVSSLLLPPSQPTPLFKEHICGSLTYICKHCLHYCKPLN